MHNGIGKRRAAGLIIFFIGIGMLLAALPLSTEFDRRDSLSGNLIRIFVMGEIVIREGVVEVIPDRDEKIYREFREYLSLHPEIEVLPESDAIDAFYEARYKERMYRNEFGLKLGKNKVVMKKDPITVPYRYGAIMSVLMIAAGVTLLMMRRKGKTE